MLRVFRFLVSFFFKNEDCIFVYQSYSLKEECVLAYQSLRTSFLTPRQHSPSLPGSFSMLHEGYHRDIEMLKAEKALPTGRVFTYVDADDFADPEEDIRMMTTLPEKPSFLTEKMRDIRRRHGTRPSTDRTDDAHPISADLNPQAQARRVVDTPFQIMHIMANLQNDEHDIAAHNEIFDHVLCKITVDVNGVLSVQPDYNPHIPYRIVTHEQNIFEYTIEHASNDLPSDLAQRESQLLSEMYQRKADVLASRVGSYFHFTTSHRVTYHVMGEVKMARGFEHDSLYMHLEFELPSGWEWLDGTSGESVTTQISATTTLGDDDTPVAMFACPFELSAGCTYAETDPPPPLPVVYYQVNSLTTSDIYRVEGFGHFSVPAVAGPHTVHAHSWRPTGSKRDVQRRFFVGGGPDLEDLDLVKNFKSNRKMDEKTRRTKVLNKFGFSTQSSGTVEFRMHVVKMKEPAVQDDADYSDGDGDAEAADGTRKGKGKGGASGAGGVGGGGSGAISKALELSRNTEAVLKAFQRAKLRSKRVRSMTSTI